MSHPDTVRPVEAEPTHAPAHRLEELTREHAGGDVALDAPVFIFGCAWRCGSTLLQRLLCTVDGLIVWGENQAVSSLLLEAGKRLQARARVSDAEREAFRRDHGTAWIANMSPSVKEIERISARWLRDLYAPATLELGGRRWGFKEVLHDAEVASFLLRLFPGGRVIFLLRNPIEVLASMRSRSWYQSIGGGARGVIRLWLHNVKSFLNNDVEHLQIRYEDLVSKPSEIIPRLEKYLDLEPGSIDGSVLNTRLRGPETEPPSLGPRELAVLCRPKVIEVGRRVGYDLPGQMRSIVRELASPRSRRR